MARKVKELRDLEIDEISLVDKGANQHARTVIAKRHGEEENTMEEYFDAEGNLVDLDSLEPGDQVFGEDGNLYEAVEEDDEDDDEFVDQFEDDLVAVGKSFNPFAVSYSESGVEGLREELSKALTDDARDEIIAKAFGQVEEYERVAKAAQATAEVERQLRLDREYTEVAKNFSVGIDPEVLGPVLKRMAESMSYSDCTVIAKALEVGTAATEEIFEEIGKRGGGANSDIFTAVEEYVSTQVSKTDGSSEELLSKAFEENPDAYDQYLAERQAR